MLRKRSTLTVAYYWEQLELNAKRRTALNQGEKKHVVVARDKSIVFVDVAFETLE